MALLKVLVDFVQADKLNPLLLAIALWAIWPGAMFVTGFVFESRFIPVGKHQSKAFLPGDLTLSFMLVSILQTHERTFHSENWWGYNPAIYAGVFILMIFVALYLRGNDVANYPKRSAMSPTKMTHDLIGYYFIPAVLVSLGLPQLIDCIIEGDVAQNLTSWIALLVALCIYSACVVYDVLRPATADDIELRHPPNWKPIWR